MRVIGGSLGGRRLVAPRGGATRPTSDRVREALFMTLEPLGDVSVVDLFAGSGALGIEALSRGARHADFVEAWAPAIRALEANLVTLGLKGRATVWPLHLPRGVKHIKGPLESADLVLLDPPYGGREARAVLEALGAEGCLRPGVRVVVEHHAKDSIPARTGRLERIRERRYGETMVTFYQTAVRTGPA